VFFVIIHGKTINFIFLIFIRFYLFFDYLYNYQNHLFFFYVFANKDLCCIFRNLLIYKEITIDVKLLENQIIAQKSSILIKNHYF
jgi:hypothetical protein